jgi:hypothetical protein
LEHVCEEAQSKTSILLEYVCEKNKIYKPSIFLEYVCEKTKIEKLTFGGNVHMKKPNLSQ